MNNDNLYDAFKQIIARHNESVKDGTYWEKNKELNETKNMVERHWRNQQIRHFFITEIDAYLGHAHATKDIAVG